MNYYYEEDREPSDEIVEKPVEKDIPKKPIWVSLFYFDKTIDE